MIATAMSRCNGTVEHERRGFVEYARKKYKNPTTTHRGREGENGWDGMGWDDVRDG